MFVYVSVAFPLFQHVNPVRVVLLLLGVMATEIVIGTIRFRRGVRYLKRSGHKGLEGYNGITYSNAADPRLWVPKLTGLGYTLNVSQPAALPILFLFLAIPLLIAFLLLVRF